MHAGCLHGFEGQDCRIYLVQKLAKYVKGSEALICSALNLINSLIIYGSFIPAAMFPDLARYGQGNGPIHLTAVSCSGSETKITQCLHSMSTSSNHQNDVGVKCGEG